MKNIPNHDILSTKSKNLKKVADEKPYFENTHQMFSPSWVNYKNPSLNSAENDKEDDYEDDDDEKLKGKGRLLKIYGGCSCNNQMKREIGNYNTITKHLEEHLQEKAGDPKDAVQAKMFKKEIKRVADKNLVSANKVKKSDELCKVSNPKEVQKNAFALYGKDAIVYKSCKANKKYQILDVFTGKFVHFGDAKMEDFTHHKDKKRQERYLKRAINIKGNWRSNPFSPNVLSIVLLW